jgi:hypothetical protein
MRKLLILAVLLGLSVIPASASPLIPASSAHVAAPGEDIVQVKKKGWRAYGWSQGRKVGWRGRGMPPGQYKKLRRY